MKKNYPRSRKDNLVIQEMDGEVMIYDLTDNKAFCLNETCALVWELCDGQTSLSGIAEALSKKLNSPASEGFVWIALEQLKREKLIENEVIAPSEFEGLTRRQTIKKIGFSSLMAIPVIMALHAPVAATAASVCMTPVYTMTCRCANTPCPATTLPANSTCTGTGGGGTTVCGPGATACLCRGPFTCVSTSEVTGTCR